MHIRKLFGATVLGLSLATGCGEGYKDKSLVPDKVEAKPAADDKKAKEAAAVAKATYNEVEHDGRLYVVASPEAAAKCAKGSHPQLSVAKIGAGPTGQTVVFEASEGGGVEKKLMEQYKAKYSAK